MKKMCLALLIIVCLALLAAGQVHGPDIEFSFDVPTMPQTPELSDVNNSSAVWSCGGSVFTVTAKIEGVTQRQACCGTNCDRTDCEISDWYMRPDPDVAPNPPCIPNPGGPPDDPIYAGFVSECTKNGNPLLYYYINDGDPEPPITMTYDPNSGVFKADVPLSGLQGGDSISYYIVASDSRGNVVAQVPNKNTAPCASISNWNSAFETPPLANCSFANSWNLCGRNCPGPSIPGKPDCPGTPNPTCGASFTINDPIGDTCDVNQLVVTGKDIVDVTGISAGAGIGYSALPGTQVFCARIGLMAPPPYSGQGEVDAYLLILFNPDIPDPNPADVYMTNAFAISYTPEVVGADPALVKVLWDGECVTNPNTADPLSCKIFEGWDWEDNLKIGYNNNSLKFIAKNDLGGGRSLIGSSSKKSTMVFLTGAIMLSGGVPFWLVDMTSGLGLIKNNKTVTTLEPDGPASPPVKKTTCKANGAGSTWACPKSAVQPPENVCSIEFLPSLDKSFVSKYKIYHNTVDNRVTATYLGEAYDVPENGSPSYTVNYSVSELDGKTHYFYLTSGNPAHPECGDPETDLRYASRTYCRVEDWKRPVAPKSFTCATPDGNEKRCYCAWQPGTPVPPDPDPDTTLYGYYLRRGSTLLNTSAILGQNFTDASDMLVNGAPVTYSLKAVDIGDNYSLTETQADCTPQDLKPPAKVDSMVVLPQPGVIGVNISWDPNTETDMAGYNIYTCKQNLLGIDCETKDGSNGGEAYTKLNTGGLIPQSETIPPYPEEAIFGGKDGRWCFYIEACDNCNTAGTCQKASPNCSAFTTMFPYRQCLLLPPGEGPAPPFPSNQAASAPPEGKKCKITWDKVCSNEEGPFPNPPGCDFPDSIKLQGYKIMRANMVGGNCAGTTVPNPAQGTPVGRVIGNSGAMEFVDTKVNNDVDYCYRVYGFNNAGNFSRPPEPAAVHCKPDDTLPPEKPDINDWILYDAISCTPAWEAPFDQDALTYNVYKCEKSGAALCNKAADYTLLNVPDLAECAGIMETECTDNTVETAHTYWYCVTAKDASLNESAKYSTPVPPAIYPINCGECEPPGRCAPPINVRTGETVMACSFGAKVWFDNAPGDDGTYAGYRIYLCTGPTRDTCTMELTTTPITGNRQTTEYLMSSISAPWESEYYLGVSFQSASGCGESQITVSAESIYIMPNDSCCDNPYCNISITLTGPFTRYRIVDNGGTKEKVTEPLAGVSVELVDSGNNIVKSKATNDIGEIAEFELDPTDISTSETYTLKARFPVNKWTKLMAPKCEGYNPLTNDLDPASDECVRALKTGIRFTAADLSGGTEIDAKPIEVPSTGGGGGEIGNTNCDKVVNISDLGPIKKAFGKSRGQAGYLDYADTNMDGAVNLEDLLPIKKNFGTSFPQATRDTGALLCKPE